MNWLTILFIVTDFIRAALREALLCFYTLPSSVCFLTNRSLLLSCTILVGTALVKNRRITQRSWHAGFETVEHKTLADFVALAIPIKFAFQWNPAHVVLITQLVLGTPGLAHLCPHAFSSAILLFTNYFFRPSDPTVIVCGTLILTNDSVGSDAPSFRFSWQLLAAFRRFALRV